MKKYGAGSPERVHAPEIVAWAARHRLSKVHVLMCGRGYGVLALRDHIKLELSESERREREDWAFEVALLMKNRFRAYEVYDEWFSGMITRAQWRNVMNHSPGMEEFRQVIFS